MSQYDPQKRQAILDARRESRKKEAREHLKERSTGENQEAARKNIDKFKRNNEAKNSVKSKADKLKGIKNLAKNATPWRILSLLSECHLFLDIPYAIALFFAILKDILDLSEVTGIGYAFVIVFTFICSAFIAMMMLLARGSGGNGNRKDIRSWLTLLSGTTAEMIFGIDILPIETLTVLIIYTFALMARKQAAEEKALERNSQEVYA